MSVALCGSSHEDGSITTSSTDIDHCEQLSEHFHNLVMNDEYNDVTFIVDGKVFPAHRVILAARCPYFRALLYGGMRESQSERIEIFDASSEAFKTLLGYIYTGKMKLNEVKESDIIDILGLANKYGFSALETSLSGYLQDSLTINNACAIYDIALLYSLHDLQNATAEFINRNAMQVLISESFLHISLEAAKSILQRDSLCVPEKMIFKCVQGWCSANPISKDISAEEATLKQTRHNSLLAVVRLPLIPLPDLLNYVRPSGLIASDMLLDAIKSQSESCDGDLRYRGILCMDENIATLQHGAQVLQGDMCASLLNGDTRNYDVDHGFTRHSISEDVSRKEKCIKVQLGQPSIINNIKMLLWDKDNRSYSYYIEVSMDDKEWTKVIDYSKQFCRSWQNLFFPKRVVRYIRIVGTHNSHNNKSFQLVSFEAMCSSEKVLSDGDVIVAQSNVATIEKSACIMEGVSRDRNALINGDMNTYDWDSGYTCHQLGNGAIVVQLAQPYWLSSMRLLLWDIDDRSYSYHIQVSCNEKDWITVADKTNIECQSWQTLEFPTIAVTFIRIVGTANTANEVFHCVHFECPASTVPVKEEAEPSQEEKKELNEEDNTPSRRLTY